MSALNSRSNSLAGLTLDAVLGGEIILPSSPPPLPQTSQTHRTITQTLFDIIRDEFTKEGHEDRTTWQIFREKLRLNRTGSAWTSSLHIPASDILLPNPKNVGVTFRSNSGDLSNDTVDIRDQIHAIPMSDPPGSAGRAMFTRGPSMRVGSSKNRDDSADFSSPGDGSSSRRFKPQLSRHDSVRDHGDGEEVIRRRPQVVTFVEERTMSAREAVAAQEAAEAAAAVTSDEEDEDEDDDNEEDDSAETEEKKSSTASAPKQTMSLMDLLEEQDRLMGLTGSRYAMEDDDEYEEDENYEEEEDGHEGEGELSCCVCMCKIKGASFTPCGHTFCKLCSKELMAQKGHCPVCSGFVLEFLEIF